MAISIDGTGTIAGITAGGLPDDSITAAELSTKTFVSYAAICDEKGYNVNGGTFTSGAWRTRDLNTEITDVDGIVSIGSNQFSLGAGNYLIEWLAPGYHVNRHFARLQNITSGTTDGLSAVMYANSTNTVMNVSHGSARVTLTGSTTYEIQHRSQTTQADEGFGIGTAVSGTNSRYTVVRIYKEA
tara:strand:- start:150 stop:704 length:555 start_codon:yes stop_codon:yes gene_type:complete